MENIVRVPIKIRKPIHKDFCDCWGTKVFSVEGTPYLLMADTLTVKQLGEMLDSLHQCVGLYFTEPISICEDKVMLALSKKLPVTIRTNSVLPMYILEEMAEVPHSAIHSSINYLEGSIKDSMEPESSNMFDMREMMFLAKSWKIFTVLSIQYQPHLIPKFDMFEVIDMTKNNVSHMLIEFPVYDDVEYNNYLKQKWEVVNETSPTLFKQYYLADVPSRMWEIKSRYRTIIMRELQEFLKFKKVGIEILEGWYSPNRLRHNLSGLSDLPMGMRPFFYVKNDDVFEKSVQVPDQDCPRCKKSIFS